MILKRQNVEICKNMLKKVPFSLCHKTNMLFQQYFVNRTINQNKYAMKIYALLTNQKPLKIIIRTTVPYAISPLKFPILSPIF